MIRASPNIELPKDYNFMYSIGYIRRAGIIPFLIDNNNITYILLGLSKDRIPVWADLGGRTEKNETTIETAIREFKEESRSVLSIDLTRTTKIVITSGSDYPNLPNQVILFVQVDPTQYNININTVFQKTIPKTVYEDEMSELRWIPYYSFLEMDKKLSKSLDDIRRLI